MNFVTCEIPHPPHQSYGAVFTVLRACRAAEFYSEAAILPVQFPTRLMNFGTFVVHHDQLQPIRQSYQSDGDLLPPEDASCVRYLSYGRTSVSTFIFIPLHS